MTPPTPPTTEQVRDRETTYAEAARVLAGHLRPDGLRVSPLGPSWSSDVDAYVHTMPDPAVLRHVGWLPLDGLLARLGRPASGQWAVVADGRVVGRVDLADTERPDPVAHLLERCRREGAGPRQRAEAEQLRVDGHQVPDPLPDREPWRVARSGVGRLLRPARSAVRPRLVVGLSGVDGSGKSTLSAELLGALDRLGLPHGRVWVRPGMVSPLVDRAVRLVKRATGSSTKPGLHAAARGRASRLASRRGLLGRVWVGVVVAEFALAVRRRYLASEGVVVFDRHRRDAEVTLRLFYDLEASDPAVRLARRALPDAAVDVHLQVAPEVSLARKQEEIVGSWAVEHQVAMYDELLAAPRRRRDRGAGEGPVVLDATRTPEEIALQVLTVLVDPDASPPAQHARDVAS
ncbi:hypothetical protein G7072_19660 [Nocardioides sp. HDW12B]|uniref:hypothetical protein n=1 Tax=Nocardioides sp. HDW12B TaxID=2714939 RepID=UPI00140DC0F3|nr:hypothetical protein [Nocardioides sp. HDW12B]QIK68266.1 hypothetical protein G7072_19660 [Nocardioides sp. HDW12B]